MTEKTIYLYSGTSIPLVEGNYLFYVHPDSLDRVVEWCKTNINSWDLFEVTHNSYIEGYTPIGRGTMFVVNIVNESEATFFRLSLCD